MLTLRLSEQGKVVGVHFYYRENLNWAA